MLALSKVDTYFSPLKRNLPLDGSSLVYSNLAKLLPLLLTPLNLTLLGKMIRPIFYILLRLCGFIILLRPSIFHRVILYRIGQVLRWTIFFYSPEIFIALLKVLTLALTAAIMYNPGTTAKSFAFIYATSILTMKLTLWLVVRTGSLMFKLITLLVRFVFRVFLRKFAHKHWFKASHTT